MLCEPCGEHVGASARRALEEAADEAAAADAATEQAVTRTDALLGTTANLSTAMGTGLVVGEAAQTASTAELSIASSVADPCDDEAGSFGAAPLDDGPSPGSFSLPSSTACPAEEQRRRLAGSDDCAASVGVALTQFNSNPFGLSADDELATPVQSVTLSECPSLNLP